MQGYRPCTADPSEYCYRKHEGRYVHTSAMRPLQVTWIIGILFDNIWNELLLDWIGGELTSGYFISIGKGKAVGKLRGISSLLGKVISQDFADDVCMGQYPMLSAGSLGCNCSNNKDNHILGQLKVVMDKHHLSIIIGVTYLKHN
ncbi:hypothetical protein TNCV_2612461 [Trichonephila clavipes]|nr:hypothetical protein TNCV_2612461 [Trichonephila clavipes]